MPDCDINARRPSVFKTTVLPPAFGPEITRTRRFESRSSEKGVIATFSRLRLSSSTG